jgi:hypothetical protein
VIKNGEIGCVGNEGLAVYNICVWKLRYISDSFEESSMEVRAILQMAYFMKLWKWKWLKWLRISFSSLLF